MSDTRNSSLLYNFGRNQYKQIVDNRENFSKLSRINTTYACRLHNNRSKWFMFYVFLARQCSSTENNSTNWGV